MELRVRLVGSLPVHELEVTSTRVDWKRRSNRHGSYWALPPFRDSHRHVPPEGYSEADYTELHKRRRDERRTMKVMGVAEVVDMGVGVLTEWTNRPHGIRSALRGIIGSTVHSIFASRFGATADDGPAAAQLARENLDAGADFIKIFVNGTALRTREEALALTMTPEQIESVAKVAEGRATVVAHCHGGEALTYCLDAGVSRIEHGVYLNRQDLMRMAASNACITLTPGVYLRAGRPDLRESLREVVQGICDLEVEFAVGTDAAEEAVGAQAVHLTELGMPASECIRAVTVDSGNEIRELADREGLLLFERDPVSEPRELLAPVAVVSAHEE